MFFLPFQYLNSLFPSYFRFCKLRAIIDNLNKFNAFCFAVTILYCSFTLTKELDDCFINAPNLR